MKSSEKGLRNLNFKRERIFRLLLIFSIGIILLSCKKESSQYYVKYEIDSKTVYYGRKLKVELKDESNNTITYTINQRELWELVIGPVENGFTAHMKVEASGAEGHLQLYPCIYISKDNGPFTLEKSDMSDEYRDEIAISYKIE